MSMSKTLRADSKRREIKNDFCKEITVSCISLSEIFKWIMDGWIVVKWMEIAHDMI